MSNGYDAAANLRAELARRRMTNAELGRLVGENEMWISRRVNGRVPITVDELLRFARALDLPAADLLAWRNPHTPRSTVLPLGGRAGPGTPMEGRTGSGPEARGVPGRGDPREGGADLPGGPTPGLAPERSGLPGGGSPPAAGQTSRPHVTHNSDDDEGIPA